MSVSLSRLRAVAATAVAGALVAVGLVATTTSASAAADHLIINEVYGGGGNSGATLTHDFIELYNPTSAAVSLTGYKLEYFSASGTLIGTCTLAGLTIASNSYFLVEQAKGNGGTTSLPTPDHACTLAMSGSNGSVQLSSATDVVDLVGYGPTVTKFEGTPAAGTTNPTSVSRTNFADTDVNSADFTVGTPTPQNSAASGSSTSVSTTTSTTTTTTTTTTTASPNTVAIADIQGTGDTTPIPGSRVTTQGVVTAAYPTGGFNGFYIQTPGSGGQVKAAGAASDAIFVFTGSAPTVTIGQCVTVTGTAGEFNGLTQLSGTPEVTTLNTCDPVVPTELATLPEANADKERYEGMLVLPLGNYTISDNYSLNQFGQLGLAAGNEPLKQATDVVPYQQAAAYEAEQVKKLITLDDGSSWNYMTNATAKNQPLPYLSQATPMRTNSQLTFTKPVILDYRFQWNFQPTGQVNGTADFIDSENDRPITVPNVGGDIQIANFNVLNYFTSLGKDEANCKSYPDREGNPVGANGCQVRGAWSQAAFDDQQAKIVAAINGMDAEVVGLMEIENSANFNQTRDYTLSKLVDALNADDPSQGWKYVPTNAAQVPVQEDNIRLAFIYRAAAVTPVDGSLILQDPAFSNARQPLAQKFAVNNSDVEFVVITNHFKSKGSGPDDGTGQGNSNPARKEQAAALVDWVDSVFADEAVFLTGDFNAYSMEEPMQIMYDAGFDNVIADWQATYQFSGRLGSLDHILANAEAQALINDAQVWEINGDESIAMQYSRRNYNITDFHVGNEFASSDHDPVVVGINAADNTPLPTYPASGVFGDHDGDGIADIYVINDKGQLELWKGSSTSATLLGTRGTSLANIVAISQIGDWNGDKRSDALVRPADGNLWIYTSDASGALVQWKQVGKNWQSMDIITYVGSLDGSANKYVVARNQDNHRLYRYTVTANGLTGAAIIGQNWDSMSFLFSVGDFNGDGLTDLMGIRASDSTLWLYLGQTDGRIGYARQVGRHWNGFKAAFSPGDLNKDGRFDLIGIDGTGRMWSYLNNGNGGWTYQRQLADGFAADKLFA